MTILIKGAYVTVTSSIFLHIISDYIYTHNHTSILDHTDKAMYTTDFCLIIFIRKKVHKEIFVLEMSSKSSMCMYTYDIECYHQGRASVQIINSIALIFL